MGKHVEYISLNKPSRHIIGSGFAGDVECTYQQLVGLFDEPTIKTDQYKTSAEWHIEVRHDGKFKGVVAIYDYKQHDNYTGDGTETKDITSWHLGAKDTWLAQSLAAFITHPKMQQFRECSVEHNS